MPAAPNHPMPVRWPARLLFIGMLLFVLFMALSPAPPPQFQTNWDKVNHAMAFFGLMVTGGYAYAPPNTQRRVGVAVVLLAIGVMIEVIQLAVPGRSSEWLDVVADAVGIALGWAALTVLLRLQRSVHPGG